MIWPPRAVTAITFLICLTFAAATALGLSQEPMVPEGSYPLIVPRDGVDAVTTFTNASFVFVAGVLFLGCAQARPAPRGIVSFVALAPLALALGPVRTWPDLVIPLGVCILLEAVW